MFISLEGIWQARLSDGTCGEMRLPGTLDENGLGHRDISAKAWHPDQELGNAGEGFQEDAPIATRFTRKYTYEGEARFMRRLFVDPALTRGKRVFLEAERARVLRLFIGGREIPAWQPASISTPYVFEVTGLLEGEHEVTLLSDNGYPGLPHDDIVYSSAATDETQTNWNGVLGYLRLRVEERTFLSHVAVYPREDGLWVRAEISSPDPWHGYLLLESEALEHPVRAEAVGRAVPDDLLLVGLPMARDVRRWDEEEGNLYEMKAVLVEQCPQGGERTVDEKRVIFGVRTFGDNGSGRLALNGRTIFLRSEANCGEFPETGHGPMEEDAWEDILRRYRSYGVNCVRFHSHCPPEAAFAAADRLGMLMQPELSHWNPRNAFQSAESLAYYRAELEAVLRMLANHPSFVMLTFGNELHADDTGHKRMDRLLELAHALDDTRLYANGSNVHYGWAGCDARSDFYTATGCRDAALRGTFAGMEGYINRSYPDARRNYDESMEILRREYSKPVFSFEVGQFEVLPDFSELSLFRGISDPANLRLIHHRVREAGLEEEWPRYVEASGELSRIGYREEVEAALRTRELSGISLLGLQDFPGQGTALVGMMNSHLEPKPFDFARPEHFRRFFRESLPLVLLEKYTYVSGETLRAEILVANFGKTDINGEVRYRLKREQGAPVDGQGTSADGGISVDGQGTSADGGISVDGGEASRSGQGASMAGRGSVAGQEALASGQGASVAGRGASGSEHELLGSLGCIRCPKGGHTQGGTLEIALDFAEEPMRLTLTVWAGEIQNDYPIWVYPPVEPVCPADVYETEQFDGKAREILSRGGKLYLTPKSDKEHLPSSIQAQFTTDFWSVGTFSSQEGGMGQLIDAGHPALRGFPTESHTNWQWWAMASRRAVILPRPMKGIVTEMDSYAYMRPMAQLVEFRCGGGSVLLSTMELKGLQQYPEARALQASLYAYLGSEEFRPCQSMEPEELAALVPLVPSLPPAEKSS